jgi:hypothetical protein
MASAVTLDNFWGVQMLVVEAWCIQDENLTLSQAGFDVWYLWNFLPQMQKFNKMNCGKMTME